MNSSIRNFFTIVLKNAVNAILTNGTMMAMLPGVFNFHDHAGLINIAKLAGSTVLAREVAVWLPLILQWSKTSADPAVSKAALEKTQN
jgi:hypothetical protein